MNKLFLCFFLLICVGFSFYDYFVDLEKNNQNTVISFFNNLSYDYYVNIMIINLSNNKTVFSLNNLSYDYYVNLMYSITNKTGNISFKELDFDYYINLDKIIVSKKYVIQGIDYDYFIILNITGKLNLTLTNTTIFIVTPKDEYLNTTKVYFNYLVNNFTGICYSIVDGKIKNATYVMFYKNVSFYSSLSPGAHSWRVICGNKTTNNTKFYITSSEIKIISPEVLVPEGDITFHIKVLSFGNTTNYALLYNEKGNLLWNISFNSTLYYFDELSSGKYLLKVVSKNKYKETVKTYNFTVFRYSGVSEADVPESWCYVLIVLITFLIYIINSKNNFGD